MGEEEKPEEKEYVVKLLGGFAVKIKGDNPDYLLGLVEGQVRSQLPGFQITKKTIEEIKTE